MLQFLRGGSAAISWIGTALPLERRSVRSLVGEQAEQFTKVTGIESVACGVSTADLLLAAAKAAPDLEGVGAIVVVTQTPRDKLPSTSHWLHKELGLPTSVLCFDLNQSCSGYVYGLYFANLLVAQGIESVLLCVGDDLHSIAGSNGALFGAAGSATLVDRNCGIKTLPTDFAFYSDGGGYHDLHCEMGRRTVGSIVMDSSKVFSFATKTVVEFVDTLSKLRPLENHKLVFHQANKQILDRIAKRLGMEIFQNLKEIGNCSSASIPLVLTDERFDPKGDLFLCGFGAGLSIAAAVLPPQRFQRTRVLVP